MKQVYLPTGTPTPVQEPSATHGVPLPLTPSSSPPLHRGAWDALGPNTRQGLWSPGSIGNTHLPPLHPSFPTTHQPHKGKDATLIPSEPQLPSLCLHHSGAWTAAVPKPSLCSKPAMPAPAVPTPGCAQTCSQEVFPFPFPPAA